MCAMVWAQITGIKTTAAQLSVGGVDTWWLDAGYNVGSFPQGQGNWSPDPSRFPGGTLAAVGTAAHAAGDNVPFAARSCEGINLQCGGRGCIGDK